MWYGENLTATSTPQGSVNLFNSGTTASVGLTGNDLSINFGPNGITSLLTETGVSGTGSPTKTFGDGWYALGIDPTGNPSNGQVFWVTFFRLLGDTNGDGVVTGPYTTKNTDAYNVYHAEGQSGALLDADVNGDGSVNSKDLTETVAARGDSVGATAPQDFPQFQLFAGAAAGPASIAAVPITQGQVQALLPEAISAWEAAGLDATDVRKLEGVPVEVGDLGTSILGLETAGVIAINRTAAGHDWSIAGAGSPSATGVDLLTVLEHELGHVIGLTDNNEAGDLMDITLGLGVRRTPTTADLVVGIGGASSTTVPSDPASVVKTTVPQPALPTGSVPLTTVDAALASILGTQGNGQDSAPNSGTSALSVGSPSKVVVSPRQANRSPISPGFRRGHLFSSMGTGKVRRRPQASGSGSMTSEPTRGD